MIIVKRNSQGNIFIILAMVEGGTREEVARSHCIQALSRRKLGRWEKNYLPLSIGCVSLDGARCFVYILLFSLIDFSQQWNDAPKRKSDAVFSLVLRHVCRKKALCCFALGLCLCEDVLPSDAVKCKSKCVARAPIFQTEDTISLDKPLWWSRMN